MKKLLVLLIVIAFCFTSCDVLFPSGNVNDGGNVTGDGTTPDTPTDDTDPDGTNPDGTNPGGDTTDKHKHSYTSERIVATCTSDGCIIYTCECGKSYVTEKTDALGHAYRGGVCIRCDAKDPDYDGGDPDGTDPGGDPDGTDPGGDTDDCTSHKDNDNNGYCDYCDEYVIVIIDIYAINDLHGKVKESDSQPGIGSLTTYLRQVMTANSVLLSSGDMWQGSSESNLTYGALVTEWMNEMGFVSMTLGNHEYDWGESYISANGEIAEFPILAINVYDTDTNERVDYATPSVVISRGGVEIGIIGAIGNCHSSISGAVSDGFYFKTGNELAALVKEEANRLRADGVDYIIYSLHDDDSAYQSVLSSGYVDLVFEAHTHQSYVNVDNYGIYHLQGGGENKGVSYALVSINTANGKSSVREAYVISKNTYGSYADDPLVLELLEKYADVIDGAYEVLGSNRQYRDDTDIEQLVADLYYQYGVEKWGDEYDIVLGGGFIRTRNPYNLYAGDVTYSDLYSLLPFDNRLVLCSIRGKDLKSKFINTTNSDYYISYGNYNISSIKDDKIYYIVTDDYTSTYSSNRLTEIEKTDDNVYARDLVADFIKKGGWA